MVEKIPEENCESLKDDKPNISSSLLGNRFTFLYNGYKNKAGFKCVLKQVSTENGVNFYHSNIFKTNTPHINNIVEDLDSNYQVDS